MRPKRFNLENCPLPSHTSVKKLLHKN